MQAGSINGVAKRRRPQELQFKWPAMQVGRSAVAPDERFIAITRMAVDLHAAGFPQMRKPMRPASSVELFSIRDADERVASRQGSRRSATRGAMTYQREECPFHALAGHGRK